MSRRNKLKMVKSVLDYGAVGDGICDDYAAIQAALDSGAEEIVIPQGIYCVSETLKVSSNTSISADKTAKIIMKSKAGKKRNEFLLSNADVKNGNRSIQITGGIWDGNNTAKEHEKPDIFDQEGYSGSLLNFVNVDGLVLKDMVLANSVTYYVRMSKLHHFAIEDISFISDKFGANQDGLHFGGDVKHGTVKNIRALSFGQTNDDLIALNADDSVERVENFDLARDDIEDISFENLYAESCHTIIRMLSVTAAIKNIRIKNVYAGFRCYAINLDGARYCRTPLFAEADYPDGVGHVSDISIENFTCYPVFELPEDWKGSPANPRVALMFESTMHNFSISGFRRISVPNEPSDSLALKATNLVNERICADGKDYILSNKDDVLRLENFAELRIE